jgi:hypothetical protein
LERLLILSWFAVPNKRCTNLGWCMHMFEDDAMAMHILGDDAVMWLQGEERVRKNEESFVCVVCLVGFVCFAVFTTAGCRKAVWSIHDQLAIMCLFMSGVLLPRTDTLYWSMAGMWHWLLAKLHCLNSFCCFFSTEM